VPIGNRYLQGQPILPYTNYKCLSGSDGFLDMQFTDHTQTPITPLSVTVELDDITNSTVMTGPTTLNPAGSTIAPLYYAAFNSGTWTLQISASILHMTYPYVGSQLCQLTLKFTGTDSVTGQPFNGKGVAIIELCAVDTVSGQ
jgi:hypothetical protein